MDDSGITKKRNYNEYYQDELFFLREMGKEFSESHPMLAHFLLEAGSDPDVERLLEGFAFLTGRIRQKLDDELPELTHTMMGMICPHYLRPIPAMSIVEFEPQRTLRGKYLIPRTKTELESSPVGNTRCRFRTCYDVELLPIGLEDVVLEGQQLKITFRILNGVQFSTLGLDKIRLNLHGDTTIQYELYNMFCRNIQKVSVRSSNGSDQEVILDKTNVKPVGFDESEGMLPYPPNSFLGYRVIQEYFSFPDKFLFIDVTGLENTSKLGIQDTFDIVFQLSRRPNENVRITKDNIHLNCTPVINLFSRSSEPIRVENERTEYRLRPEGPNSNHYEVYSVDKVFGMIPGTAQQYEYKAFYSFTHSLSERGNIYYQTRLRDSVTSENSTETYVSFINADQSVAVPTTEIISSELTCINRQLTEQLRLGDIKIPTSNSPEVARFKNITNVTPTIYSPIGGSLHWKLISHLTLNRLSITSKEALQGILSLYNFQALVDRGIGSENERRINSISNVQGVQKDRLYRGTPIRGMEIQLDMQENNFINDGDMYLFCCMLNEFLALYSNINSFSQLTVRSVNRGGGVNMGYEDRETDHPLIRRIQEEGHRFSFFQTVYLLEQYCNSISKIARVGNQGPANIECIRFKPEASLGFPASDVVSIEKVDNSGSNLPRFQVTTSFFGLYGTDSPLPDFYTEDIIQADPDESNVKDFLDIFHHRLLSLFYRCWLKYRYYLQFLSDGNDEFSKRVFAFVGMGTPGLTEKLKISPVRLLRYVGLFMQQNHSASALGILLSDYFDGIPVKIEECIGRWVKIDEEDRSTLGAKNSQLGTKITVGNRVFDRTGKFRVTMSVATFKEFTRFLPNGDNFKALKEIIEAFLPSPLDFELELILPGSEVPMPSLEGSMQLGWTSWSASTQPTESVSVIFQNN